MDIHKNEWRYLCCGNNAMKSSNCLIRFDGVMSYFVWSCVIMVNRYSDYQKGHSWSHWPIYDIFLFTGAGHVHRRNNPPFLHNCYFFGGGGEIYPSPVQSVTTDAKFYHFKNLNQIDYQHYEKNKNKNKKHLLDSYLLQFKEQCSKY